MAEQNESKKAPAAKSSTDNPNVFPAAGPTSGDGGNAEVQEKMDEINEKGYAGIKVDPTPNENYTLKGAGSGAPTPENDPEQAAKAQAHAAKVRAGTVDDEHLGDQQK